MTTVYGQNDENDSNAALSPASNAGEKDVDMVERKTGMRQSCINGFFLERGAWGFASRQSPARVPKRRLYGSLFSRSGTSDNHAVPLIVGSYVLSNGTLEATKEEEMGSELQPKPLPSITVELIKYVLL
ncbi:hypothetical protein R1sor_007638 [Riccia sorocarpa]|uniref:Uncharacterized protein n=1 Tax=Riccia sorocarpa TaxID=122646 RepID=A0ABD3HUH6_9MARC